MIHSISLRNFQGHKTTDLEFGPGINVITGQSDAGKSSIIRALWWILKNRPSGGGETFKFSGIERGGEVSATVGLGEGEIVRFYKGGKNGYRVNDQELVAIKTDVPQEVLSVLDMDDHNIQPQHQPYFLLADGPAEVARKLNAICGLDVIDACLKNASLLVSRNASDTKTTQDQIEHGRGELGRFGDLMERETAVLVLEEKQQELAQIQQDHARLVALSAACSEASKGLNNLEGFLAVESPAQVLFTKQEELSAVQGMIGGLENALRGLTTLEVGIKQKATLLDEREQQFHQQLEDLGRCPFCEQEIKA